MKLQHSLVSPSNFERRMLCPGSLNAEKDLPDVYSKYADEGKLLHERTTMYISSQLDYFNNYVHEKSPYSWKFSLTEEQQNAVKQAGDYFLSLYKSKDYDLRRLGNARNDLNILYPTAYTVHEKTYDLSFIYPGMKGTADTVFIARNIRTNRVDIHVIDYKFGKGVAVSPYKNYQLMLYYLGVIHDPEIKEAINGDKTSVHLHIVQPFIRNNIWVVSDEEIADIENLKFYQDVVTLCHSLNAKRYPSKEACRFCKAKAICPALAAVLPDPNNDLFNMEDAEIAAIYDKKELISMYMTALEDYIMDRLTNGTFDGYKLVDKISNRKWNDRASVELSNILGDKAFETTTKLITISKAEQILGRNSQIINKLTTKEVTGMEIVKQY